jgi:hypothetical protein
MAQMSLLEATGMMKPGRSAKVAGACGTLLLVGWLASSGPAVVERTAAVAPVEQPGALLPAEVEVAGAPQAAAMCVATAVNGDTAMTAEPATAAAAEPETEMLAVPATAKMTHTAAVSEQPLIVEAALHDSPQIPEPEMPLVQVAALQDSPQIVAPETPLVQMAALHDSAQIPAPETPLVQVATANPSGPVPDDVKQAVSRIEILEECLVVEVCIDRYLWALYQRTPKEDTIKVHERRKVTVRRKGKSRTVTRTFTRLVNEDFGWKDPKAAEKAGMQMMDYVIGGMDRSFKTKLFHALHAAEAAGMSPGITSAFRDDYRQSIATGMKAATDRSYHGGSFRGGYGHGLAADVVSVNGATRGRRWVATEAFWKWIDEHGKEFGVGRPYLGRDPPHVGPIDGKEYAAHNGGTKTRHAEQDNRKLNRLAMRDDRSTPKTLKKRKVTQAVGAARTTRQGAIANRPAIAMAERAPG